MTLSVCPCAGQTIAESASRLIAIHLRHFMRSSKDHR
jgi:hypothetical protein